MNKNKIALIVLAVSTAYLGYEYYMNRKNIKALISNVQALPAGSTSIGLDKIPTGLLK